MYTVGATPMIIAVSNSGLPSGKVDIALHIQKCVNHLSDSGNDIIVHWVPENRDIDGNELADSLAKDAANEWWGLILKISP